MPKPTYDNDISSHKHFQENSPPLSVAEIAGFVVLIGFVVWLSERLVFYEDRNVYFWVETVLFCSWLAIDIVVYQFPLQLLKKSWKKEFWLIELPHDLLKRNQLSKANQFRVWIGALVQPAAAGIYFTIKWRKMNLRNAREANLIALMMLVVEIVAVIVIVGLHNIFR